MSNTIFITANWTTGALSQQTISRQYDNNRYAVQFIGYPEGDGTEELDLYLLVWMSTAPGQKPGEITPIQLNSDQWYISNYFTQQVQVIKFQLCVLNEAGTYEAHSPIFSGRIGDSLEHDGTSQDIDVSTLFDAYREYLNELIIRAGAVVIDSTLSQSGQAADALETGRRFERVYSYESGGSSAGSGNVWVEYSVKAGHTYTFTNTSSVAISPNTVRAINTYDYIEQLGIIQAGKTLTFTAVADAPALMVYSGGASTWTIAEQTTIFNLYEKTSNIDSINNDIVGLKYSAGKIGQIISAIDASEQYLNNTAWEEGYFNWTSGSTPINKVSAVSPWYRQEIKDLPSGTYYFNAFCSPGFTFFVDKVTGTAYRASDLGVTQGVSGSLTFENAFDAYITIYDSATMSKDVAMFASGKLPASYVYGLYKINGLYTNAQGQTIYIVGEGYIPTIQGACDLASDNDIIFIRCGTYEEQVSIWTRKLHLIGEDKLNTVLIDHSGYYDTPPLEMAKGSLSNLTIIEDGTEPFSDSSDSKYMMAYCLHIEHPNATGETFEIDNCNFINEIHVPLGCGLRGNNTVRFRNCRFYCGATDETVSQERGAFFVHSENAKNVENQWVIAENCIMESKGPRLAAMFGVPSGAQNTGSMYIRLSNCTLWNDNRGVADSTVTFDTGGGADVMKLSHSYGNSISALNGND